MWTAGRPVDAWATRRTSVISVRSKYEFLEDMASMLEQQHVPPSVIDELLRTTAMRQGFYVMRGAGGTDLSPLSALDPHSTICLLDAKPMPSSTCMPTNAQPTGMPLSVSRPLRVPHTHALLLHTHVPASGELGDLSARHPGATTYTETVS